MTMKIIFALIFFLSMVKSDHVEFWEGPWEYANGSLYGYYQGYLDENDYAEGYGLFALRPGLRFLGAEQTHFYQGEYKADNRQGYGQFFTADHDNLFLGEVDVLPNGFGVLFTDHYSYVGHFKDGDFDGEGLLYHFGRQEGSYGLFKNNRMVSGDVLPLKTRFANDRIAFCQIKGSNFYFKGICRNGQPDGLGYWNFEQHYDYWGEFEIIDGYLYNHGWGIEIGADGDDIYSFIGHWEKNEPKGRGLLNHLTDEFVVVGNFDGYEPGQDALHYEYYYERFLAGRLLTFLTYEQNIRSANNALNP